MLNRRTFLFLLMTSLAGGFAVAGTGTAMAKDGDGGGDGGGDSDGGGDGGGNDDGGKDDDGGGDNSGHGGDDDKNDDDRDDDDKDDDDRDDDDKNRIRAAVKRGDAESLGRILPAVRRKYPGKVVRIRLTGTGNRMTYRIRVINSQNKLIEVRVNAQSGKILGVYSL
jgi:hypothetical protein